MRRLIQSGATALAVILLCSAIADAAIYRTSKRYQVFTVEGGFANPIGEYGTLTPYQGFVDPFGRPVDIKADELYNNSGFFGLSYGWLVNDHGFASVGFRYTPISVDSYWEGEYLADYGEVFDLDQFDITFDLNYYLANPMKSGFSPYAGLGFTGGLTSLSSDTYEAENDVTFSLGLNFGADFVVWSGGNDRAVALSSINSLQLLASDIRPKYLQIGLGLKFFFSGR